MTTHTLRFRAVNRDTFDAIKRGKKKIETRAATTKYRTIAQGDSLRFVCGKDEFSKKIASVEHFRSVKAMLEKYEPQEINPKAETEAALRAMYRSFPGYTEKLKKFGLLAFKLR